MKTLLEKSFTQEAFSEQEAIQFIYAIASDQLSSEAIAGILVSQQLRGISLQEMRGYRKGLLDLSIAPTLDTTDCIDVCGTGGDGKNTFNISTCSALLLASMGRRVIKHGNYAVSSKCGSSDVLLALGFQFHTKSEDLQKQLETTGLCFLHAPYFHPTLQKVAPVRAALGTRTLFNTLGPLVNPVQPPYQVAGTYSLGLAHIYQHLLREDRTDFHIVHSMDGYDEISLTDDARIVGKHEDRLLMPEQLGVRRLNPERLFAGKSVLESARLLHSILAGKASLELLQVVAANSALALYTLNSQTSIESHFENCLEYLQSGKATHIIPQKI